MFWQSVFTGDFLHYFYKNVNLYLLKKIVLMNTFKNNFWTSYIYVCVYAHVNIYIYDVNTSDYKRNLGGRILCMATENHLTGIFWLCSKTSICYNTQALLLVLCLFHQHITLTGATADILINLTLFYVELQANVDERCWLWGFRSFFLTVLLHKLLSTL